MTQMLLFDSPVNVTETVIATAVSTAPQANATPSPSESNIASQLQHDSGLHHMGDLARLVLLRYDLVAKRRALMAARKAK